MEFHEGIDFDSQRSLTLQPGKAKTVRMKLTETAEAITRALRARTTTRR